MVYISSFLGCWQITTEGKQGYWADSCRDTYHHGGKSMTTGAWGGWSHCASNQGRADRKWLAHCDPLPPARLHFLKGLQPSRTAPPAGNPVFKHRSRGGGEGRLTCKPQQGPARSTPVSLPNASSSAGKEHDHGCAKTSSIRTSTLRKERGGCDKTSGSACDSGVFTVPHPHDISQHGSGEEKGQEADAGCSGLAVVNLQ